MLFLSIVYAVTFTSLSIFLKKSLKDNKLELLALILVIVFSFVKSVNMNFEHYNLIINIFGLLPLLVLSYKLNKIYAPYLVLSVAVLMIISYYFFKEHLSLISSFLVGLISVVGINQILWASGTILLGFSYLLNLKYYEFLFIGIFLYILNSLSTQIKSDLEKEKRSYRIKLNKNINLNVKQKLEELNEEIGIINKKVKNLFELSNYSISTNNIDDMAKRVVNGLKKLGYTGVFFYLEKSKKLFKEGFFPNLMIILKNPQDYRPPLNQEKNYIFIPIAINNRKIGVLGVYKKTGIPEEEKEYLFIYANTISIFLEKVYYLREISKLKEITSKVLEAIDIGIAVLDKELNIKFHNEAFKLFLKSSTSKNLLEILPQLKPLKDELLQVVKNEKKIDTVISSPKQGEYIYHIKAFPMTVNHENNPDSILILIEDITMKEELEAHVIQTEKLAVLGKLVASLSHDIRNPLAAISQAAFRIKRLSQKISNSKLEELAKVIEKNVKRTSDIMERLLNFSKPAYQKAEIVSLGTILDEALELSLVKKHNIEINKNIEKDIYIYGDKNALTYALVNLIMNSLEAMDFKGKIKIEITKKEGKAVLKISDTGKGIPEHIKDKIFEPFFTTKDEGTGLGLYILKKVINDHGGSIKFESKSSKGTTFIIELPAVEEF